MTDVKALLDAATPLPWAWQATGDKDNSWAIGQVVNEDEQPIAGEVEPGEGIVVETVAWNGVEALSNAALIVHAVNRLPDYEAAVDALDEVLQRLGDAEGPAIDEARAVLRRLRGEA